MITIHSSLLSDSMPFEKVVSDFSPVDCSWSLSLGADAPLSLILDADADAPLSLILDAVTALTHFLCIVFCVQFFLVS